MGLTEVAVYTGVKVSLLLLLYVCYFVTSVLCNLWDVIRFYTHVTETQLTDLSLADFYVCKSIRTVF